MGASGLGSAAPEQMGRTHGTGHWTRRRFWDPRVHLLCHRQKAPSLLQASVLSSGKWSCRANQGRLEGGRLRGSWDVEEVGDRGHTAPELHRGPAALSSATPAPISSQSAPRAPSLTLWSITACPNSGPGSCPVANGKEPGVGRAGGPAVLRTGASSDQWDLGRVV